MSEDYSDEEALELQEEDQSNQRWPANNSSERIRRSCASTDIAALQQMDVNEMGDESGQEEMEEHHEALPQEWIDYYKGKFSTNTFHNRWQLPLLLDDRFRALCNKAVEMCETGHPDGTFDVFINDNLVPLFRKWYYTPEALEHWPIDCFKDMAECNFKVLKMFRGLICAGAGSRDISFNLWDLFTHIVSDMRPNAVLGDRLNLNHHMDVDLSAENYLIKPEHVKPMMPIWKYERMVILAFDREGFQAIARFFKENITDSTPLEEIIRYLKAFRCPVVMLHNDRGYSSFAEIAYASFDRLTNSPDEEKSVKNLRGPLGEHILYALYSSLVPYVNHIAALSNNLILDLMKWRLDFCLSALVEAPFNGKMSAVDCLGGLISDFGAPNLIDHVPDLHRWLEEERVVVLLTKDHNHHQIYVERERGVFEQMLHKRIFTTSDLSTVWEAQRGKHDAIQRNMADLIVRITPLFDNELLEGLFHKIQAGWHDGGPREREMLIDIVKRIGENSAININTNRMFETDQAQLHKALDTVWKFIRLRVPGAEKNLPSALEAHIRLLEESHEIGYVKNYAELCAADIRCENAMAATAAKHLVGILDLVEESDEEDDDFEGPGRRTLIGGLLQSHNIVEALCNNVAKTLRSFTVDLVVRSDSLEKFLSALSYTISQNRDVKLSEDQASVIWVSLIKDGKHEDDKNNGFKFFLNVVDASVFPYDMLERLFNTYVLALPADSLTCDGYQCFESFFKAVNNLQHKKIDFNECPDNLLGSSYVRELILRGSSSVHHRATNLWVEYLEKIIWKVGGKIQGMAAKFVQSLVDLISEQYEEIGAAVSQAAAIGLSPTKNPIYDAAKERTMRCIKMLNLLVTEMDDEVAVAKRSVRALGKAAVGRHIFVNLKVPRREWESIPQEWRGTVSNTDLDITCDVHSNTTIAELRELLRTALAEKLFRLKAPEYEEILVQFLLVHGRGTDEGIRPFCFSDYKRTLGEMNFAEVVELEIRLMRGGGGGMRGGGDDSLDTSTSDIDWVSPEGKVDDSMERILPSRALAADERMVDRLLHVAESGDVNVAMAAFGILTAIPPNETKLTQLHAALMDEEALLGLLDPREASDCRFLYYIMMIESMIIPADSELPIENRIGLNAMTMFIRVLPRFGELAMLMNRAPAFRSLAVQSITRIINMASGTAARHIISNSCIRYGQNNDIASLGVQIIRMGQVNLPIKWSKHMRIRRLNSLYGHSETSECDELLSLVQTNSSLLMRWLCAVILSGSSFHSCTPFPEQATAALVHLVGRDQLLMESVIESNPHVKCSLNGLLEVAVHGLALLAIATPRQSAETIGAVSFPMNDVFLHTITAASFYRALSVRMMATQLTIEMVEHVRSSLMMAKDLDGSRGPVSLITSALDLLPNCRGTDQLAEQFVSFVRECVCRSKSWNAVIERLDYHIDSGVQFLEEALLNANERQTPYRDETLIKARIEVLRFLVRDASVSRRAWLGSGEGGPRLCERLLSEFIFPADRIVDPTAADAGDSMRGEHDSLPRSVTHMEMNSSSSLFELREEGASMPRSQSALPMTVKRVAVCSAIATQNGVYQLLLVLCDSLPVNQVLMQSTIHRLFYSNPWTDKKDFEYHPQHVLRLEGELAGLKNGGATCYMNSIFQQLFMIDEIRDTVLNALIPEKVLQETRTSPSPSPSSKKGQSQGEVVAIDRDEYAVKVLVAVQNLFASLLGTELDSYRPADFWKVFNFKSNGEAVNVREQQDAVEFHNMVTDLIDAGLKKLDVEPICCSTFKGVFADEKICKDCPHRYSKEEVFEVLSLDVRSHNNLRDSLKEYVKGDVLENDNAYACEKCDMKVKAVKRTSILKLPEVLIIQLKRFEFDWMQGAAEKFNDYFEFPFDLDMQPYTTDGLEKLENNLKLEDNKDFKYLLRGVVVHSGQAQGGHYTSYIRNRETGKWFKFDDSEVTPWDATEGAPQRWFGIMDTDSMGRGKKKTRGAYWNAYILFYEKLETANKYLVANPSSMASDLSTSSGVSSMTTPMPVVLPSSSSSTVTASTSGTTTAVTPNQDDAKRWDASASPVSNLHRHFSSMSLSTAIKRMPPRLEEMLREANRRVQLERVQYSTHYFNFITSATAKALATAELHPNYADALIMATMKSFGSFIVHNGLFASRDLMSEEALLKCSFTSWQSMLLRLLSFPTPRLWFITHVLFSHEIAACFLFSSDPSVREFFQNLIVETMTMAEANGDLSEACLRPNVASPLAHQLANAIRQFPRLSHLLAHLLGILPYKHNEAFKHEQISFHRTIVDLAAKPNMLAAIVKGGVLNNLLTLFSPAFIMTNEMSTLQRKDSRVYEELHRVIADALRTIVIRNAAMPNPYSSDTLTVLNSEVPDLRVSMDFQRDNGGHVKFIQHLYDFIRRATRSSTDLEWASKGILYLCWTNERASTAVMDFICQGLGNLLTETATDLMIKLLNDLFALNDNLAAERFDHIFYRVHLTSLHAHPSIQGLVDFLNVSENRYEVLIRVALAALEAIPEVYVLINADNRVREALDSFNTIAVTKMATSRWCRMFHSSYEDLRGAGSVSGSESSVLDVTGGSDSMMESNEEEENSERGEREERGAAGDRPTFHHEHIIQSSSSTSPSQLSPSARMGALSILSNVGEKRPLPPTEEGEETDGSTDGRSDRKRSIGETKWRGGVTPTPMKIEDYAASPMDDSDLLISSSMPSTSRGPPTMPPPAYETIGGAAVVPSPRALPLVPPPVPPRPNARLIGQPKSPQGGDEFVQKHRE